MDDGSTIAKMMQYFKFSDPDDMSRDALSRRVQYLKQEKGGYERMSAEAEELYNLGVEDGMEQGIEKGIAQSAAAAVIRMLQDKLPVEKIAVYQNMSVDEVRRIEAGIPSEV